MRHATWMALLACAGGAQAQALEVRGFIEARAVAPADETGWRNGGLGKTRFGDGDDAIGVNAAIAASWQATPSLLASASAQVVPDMQRNVDLLDAWVRYRPVSTTPWRFSFTAGMFFAPISLENDGVGWTSPWTLTPSAINSWVGEELRTFGGEVRIEHRGEQATWDVRGALFTKNDPAGELLASRGWAMGDLTSGYSARVRQPDVHAARIHGPTPLFFAPFLETDDRLGGYLGVGVTGGGNQLRALFYDNRTDPASEVDYAERELYGWRTRFWSFAAQREAGDWTFVAQAMTGTTRIAPEEMVFDTDFNAGYLLATRTFGAWQPVLRVDLFQARQTFMGRDTATPSSEHGHAWTVALNWRPNERVRVIGEVLRVESARDQRRFAGESSRQADVQVQLAVRAYF